jgi:putative endopeptidase
MKKLAAPSRLLAAVLACLGSSIAATAAPPAGAAGAPTAAAPPAASSGAHAAAAAAAEPLDAAGVSRTAMDPKADPCVDFYQYACGGFVASHPVPPDRTAWNRFVELAERNRQALHQILEADAKAGAGATADQRKLGDFYATCMDEAVVEHAGVAPIQAELDQIAALKSTAGLATLVARLRGEGVNALFSFRSGQDLKDATQVIAMVDQGGLSLPDRDYYLKTDDKSVEQRTAYAEHLKRMFVLLGEPAERAAADAATVLEIETALAKGSLDRVSRRDPYKLYHKVDRVELGAMTPAFSWDAFLAELDVPPVRTLNVAEPDFMKAAQELLTSEPVEKWQTYLRWQLLRSAAPWLSSRFVDEDFAFTGKTLGGAKKLLPRWERCVEATDRAMGEALGREFVASRFDPAAKQRTQELVGELDKALATDIESLTWMSDVTKKRAEEKLQAIANKIGYPAVWRDYSKLRIVRGDLVGNVQRAAGFELTRRLDEIGHPVNRQEWNMSPPTVNAYYSPSMNDINFPAGILQWPFYDPHRDDAVNYGGIGAVIGHEMTHGFDDQGRQFGPTGNLADWWTPADADEFKKRATCLADEYSTFPAGGLKVNGRLTLGENGADNGGLRIAYMAYEASQAGKPRQTLDGFTPEQRLFLGFGQVWCNNTTPEAERLQVLTNPHSPGRYRCDGVVVNMPEFQQAFHCPAGSPMAPENRCRIW